MLELAASHIEKGRFELRLEGDGPRWARWIVGMGPSKSRLFALSFIVVAALLNLTTAPAAFFLDQGWVANTFQALSWQAYAKWIIAGLGMLIWLVAFGARREELILQFDRMASKLHYRYAPQFTLAAVDEGEASFDGIRRIEVFAPTREPRTPHGFIEIEVYDAQEQKAKSFRFKLLSEDQFKIYPTNLGRFTGKEPVGDWTDPDSLAPV
jgi:hypothetical protein